MLLLFWKALGLNIGVPIDIKWIHSSAYPPRCLVPGELGLSVVNPYLAGTPVECCYALTNEQCNTSDVYGTDILVGTQSNGLYKLPWSSVTAASCPVESPVDLSADLETFTTFSGLLSQNIISLEANGDHLSVVTDLGVCYGKQGNGDYICYTSASGVDSFVTKEGRLYYAEGNRVLCQGEISSPLVFGIQYNLSSSATDIWVTEKDGIDTLFVATQSGVEVFEKDTHFHYGDRNYSQVKAEVNTTINQGHLFLVSGQTVDVLNLKTKELENSIDYGSDMVVVAIENKRLYSK